MGHVLADYPFRKLLFKFQVCVCFAYINGDVNSPISTFMITSNK